MSRIARRERIAIIQALSAGAVPPAGLQHLQVGRDRELDAVLEDLRQAEEGMASVRFVAGPPECGKTFFLHLLRSVAIDRRFVVAQACLTPDRLLDAHTGEARALYGELMKNLVAPVGPQGISLGSLIQHWIGDVEQRIRQNNGATGDVEAALSSELEPLFGLANGFDFATVLMHYYEGCVTHNTELQGNALRWLRAEYTSAEQARTDLGVHSIIDDRSLPNSLALFATFARIAGYAGFLVNLDDLGVLASRLRDPGARTANFAAVRELMDSCLQGRAAGLVVLFGVEDSGLDDRQRGLKSDDILAKRLAPNRFASNGYPDLASPVIRLRNVAREDFPRLLNNVQQVFADGEHPQCLLPEEGIDRYLRSCDERFGPEFVRQPCETVKDFVGLLRVLERDSTAHWSDVLDAAKREEARQREREADLQRAYGDYGWPGGDAAGGYRGRRFRGRGALGIVGVIMALGAMGLVIWAMMYGATPKLEAALEVKCSDIRGGVRLPLDEQTLPLEVGKYFSLDARLTEPAYAWLLKISPGGRVELMYGHDQADNPPQVGRVQLPGGEELWPVSEPEGTYTVVLLASRSPAVKTDDLQRDLRNLCKLQSLPQAAPTEMLIMRGGEVQTIRNLRPKSSVAPLGQPSKPGLLGELTKVFGHRFEVVQAVAFPVVAKPVESGPLLYDTGG